jgi:hypothetical protein
MVYGCAVLSVDNGPEAKAKRALAVTLCVL